MPYYDEAGNELDPSTITVPKMCLLCEKHGDAEEKILCDLNRLDQRYEPQFICGGFESVYGPLIDDIIV